MTVFSLQFLSSYQEDWNNLRSSNIRVIFYIFKVLNFKNSCINDDKTRNNFRLKPKLIFNNSRKIMIVKMSQKDNIEDIQKAYKLFVDESTNPKS